MSTLYSQIFLNAFPLEIPDHDIEACDIPYDQEQLEILRVQFRDTHLFRRHGNRVFVFSADGQYPATGETVNISLQDEKGIFCFLVKHGLKKYLAALERCYMGFNPIEILSKKKEDDLLAVIIGKDYPIQIIVRYRLNTRIVGGKPCLIVDCSTRMMVSETCSYFIEKGYDLKNRFVVVEQEDGFRKILGRVHTINGQQLQVVCPGGSEVTVHSEAVYLEASRTNVDDYISHTHSAKNDIIFEKIRLAISSFNGGQNKRQRIDTLFKYFQSKGFKLINGTDVMLGNAEDIQQYCVQQQRPIFVFNDSGEANWVEKGLAKYGPYTKRTFDRNDPSICVICSQHDKGRVEQFVRKLLKGMPNSAYFKNGLEGKFSIGTSRVEVFTTDRNDVVGYKLAIESAIKKKAENGSRWDLALVQVRESFKPLKVVDNPYFCGKNLFLLHQVPVQDFTIELLEQTDYSLGYSLNNMALACYAKMSGVPWLLKSSPTLSHELVVGIGSAQIGRERFGDKQRIMGITTVFSGDGSYIISNTSKAVVPDDYCDALMDVLGETIQKIQKRMNWQKGDTIRLIFHAAVKKFNKDEIKAVRSVVDKYRDYQVEYAFLKISENHGLHMFDTSTAKAQKGKFAPPRGKTLKLSKNEMLVYLVGQRQLRQSTAGHPRGVIVNLHRDSTFKDIKYLSSQLFSFSSHSWRSYFPNPMPVTISYSDLIAKNLGWLNQLPGWNNSIMIGKIGQSQWFL